MKTPLHVLLVEDSEDDALLLIRELTRYGYAVTCERVQTAPDLRRALARPEWEIVLSDYSMPHLTGETALQIVRADARDLPFIFTSATMGEDIAVAAMRSGANDYVMKDNLARLGPAVARELRDAVERHQRRVAEAALRNVLRHARTIVVHTTLTAPPGPPPGAPDFHAAALAWDSRIADETAAREVLPLDVAPESNYAESWRRAMHPDDRATIDHAITRALANRQSSWRVEFRSLDRHGATHWFSQVAYLEALGPGRWWVTTVSSDITERKLAEEALRTSEERLSTIFHLSPTAICVLRAADNCFVDVNEAFCAGTGYARGELLGKTPFATDLWPDASERDAILTQLREHGAATAVKIHGRRKSGEIGVGLASVARITLHGEAHLLWLLLDISDLARAQEALRTSEQRFRQVTENIDEVFWLTDAARREFIYVSPAYRCVFGRECESLAAQPQSWLDAIHEDDRSAFDDALAALPRNDGYNLEYRIARPDGSVRWVHDRAFAIRDAEGNVVRIAGVAADVTNERQLETQLRQAQKMESLGTLAGGIAHDFNNILTGVLGSAEVARMELPADHRALPWLENIVGAGNRARNLVQQILTIARKHESVMVARRLDPVLDEAFRLLRSSIPSMVQLELKIDPRCPPVVADDTQIHQVVMNLCTNAWHALPEQGGRIDLGLAPREVDAEFAATHLGLQPGPHALLTVRDNGCGMPPDVLARIFEPFFTTKQPGEGTGLGLAVVHGIVQSHRGAIFVDSEPGRGTTFEIYLPALAQPAAAGDRADNAPLPRGSGQHILLVDDDTVAREGLRGQLAHLGYRVTALGSARVALAHFLTKRKDIDLVLTDYAMPDLDGGELAARILDVAPGFPVLFVSGYVDGRLQEKLRALGVRELVRKPAELADLAPVIARHVRSRNKTY
ncbi:MAG: PAS domain S-box protein [Opitutae bacterium]|nr:PAS domain S-box protein [Opitutae bacterium]